MSTTKTTASGVNVKPVSIKGKDYITVSQRIAEVNASKMVPRFEIIDTQFIQFGGINICQVTIKIEGKQFIGSASCNIGGKGVDATNPIENAETSALGRALGLAGFGSLESVASAEEVVSAISRSESGYKAPVKAAQNNLASKEQLEEIQNLAHQVNLAGAEFAAWLRDSYNTSWSRLNFTSANAVIDGLHQLKEAIA